MKKWMFLGILLFAVASIMSAQQTVKTKSATSSQTPDSVPMIIVIEEEALDSVPMFTGNDMGMLLTDTVPTPEWMTVQMVEVGAVEPSQIPQVNKINTKFVRRVKDLAAKKNVSPMAMKGAAAAHDDELKAVLSDQQVQAYQGVKDKIHKRVWHHHCHMCHEMMGN